MYKFVITLITLLNAIVLHAQHEGYKQLQDIQAFKQQFAAASQKTKSIHSDFVQEKNLSMLSEKIVSKGKFWFKKDNLVRMEYNTPFKYLVVINKSNVLIKDEQKENKMSSKSNKLFQQINKIIVDCVQGTALDNPDFTVKVFEGKNGYLIELSPKVKTMKDLFKNINVIVEKKELTIFRMEMIEQTGDNTIINFLNKELNTDIPDALFAIK
jgi:outer membrane lipoprotein-sorting protein